MPAARRLLPGDGPLVATCDGWPGEGRLGEGRLGEGRPGEGSPRALAVPSQPATVTTRGVRRSSRSRANAETWLRTTMSSLSPSTRPTAAASRETHSSSSDSLPNATTIAESLISPHTAMASRAS